MYERRRGEGGGEGAACTDLFKGGENPRAGAGREVGMHHD